MRLVLTTLLALLLTACSPSAPDGNGASQAGAADAQTAEEKVAEDKAKAEAKKEAQKKADAAKKKMEAKAAAEKKEADRRASWVRTPVKKVPAPKDVRQPPKKGATSTMAGVKYRVLKAGEGKGNPKISSQVTIHYTGWTTNGRMFDSTMKTGEPATFGLSGLIDGWKDVIQYMVIGDVFRVWIPQKLAYKGKAGRPAGTLVFDIELLDFK
ncbi:MAG: FKBP-type peptidyl-prolyl cis-trans isomerase [Myxococcota bacterium]